jgi:16S rRNA A1518/A1519 N6-dimethyltransferase RsmA/KsgA/DIM1 with predicted DNA glycosylase/AP lyase activity
MIFLYLFALFLFFLISIAFIIFLSMQILAVFTTQAPFIPIPKEVQKDVIENIELNGSSVLYDLGCGDGRILIEASKKYPQIRAVGVDMGFMPYFLAKFYTKKYKNITIKREDIFKTDIGNATHIFLYLYPKVINKLVHNIRTQCKSGTKIVSCDFEISNEIPIKIVDLQQTSSSRGKKLFIYEI